LEQHLVPGTKNMEKKERIKTSWGKQNLVHETNRDYKRKKNLAYVEQISTKE
jgi:hypothetical protein